MPINIEIKRNINDVFIPGAFNFEFSDRSFINSFKELSRTLPLFIYCSDGIISEIIAEKLSNYGFTEVYKLDGGYKAWKEYNSK